MQTDRTARSVATSLSSEPIGSEWGSMFRVGSVTFTLLGAMFLISLAGEVALGTIPSANIGEAFSYIVSHSFNYNLVYGSELAAGFLLFPSILSVFLVLRRTNKTWASVGFGTMAIGIPIFFLVPTLALTTFSLAGSYSTFNNQAESAAILAAGLSSLSGAIMLAKLVNLIFGIGSLINGILFAKSRYFGRAVAVPVLAGSCFGLIGTVLEISLVPAIIFFAVAFLVTGLKLSAISRRSVPL